MNNTLIIIPILVILFVLLLMKRVENFDTETSTTSPPTYSLNQLERQLSETILNNSSNGSNNNNGSNGSNSDFKNTDLERVARAVAKQYCKCPDDYDSSTYVKKTTLKDNCPKMPNLEDYIHKSAQQPQQKCPACICPNIEIKPNNDNSDKCDNIIESCKDNVDFKTQLNELSKDIWRSSQEPLPKCLSKDELMDNINCPPPQPCPVYKDIIKLVHSLLDNKTEHNKQIIEMIRNLISEKNTPRPTTSTTLGTTTTTTYMPTTTSYMPTTTLGTTSNPTKPKTTLSEICANNQTYYRRNNTTIAPSNINNLVHRSQQPQTNRRAMNMNHNGESDESSVEEDEYYPASNSDKCVSAPLRIS
jgi:hypothetical protein